MAHKWTGGAADPGSRAFRAGLVMVTSHPLFAPLAKRAWIGRPESGIPDGGWANVTENGTVSCHPSRRGTPDEWAYVIAHALLHLGFSHFRPQTDERAWNAACCACVARFLADLRFGTPPEGRGIPSEVSFRNEESLYHQFRGSGIPRALDGLGLAGNQPDMLFSHRRGRKTHSWALIRRKEDWADLFARGLREAVRGAVAVAAGRESKLGKVQVSTTPGRLAREWFIARYPLLGALAAGFTIIEDADLCRRLDIQVAAVDAEQQELYLNPRAALDEEETRFVMAHELLHVALNHHGRRLGRDPFLWNCAADYVINRWLIEMNIGRAPNLGLLHDPELAPLSAEEIYDRIARDLRRYRRLTTFRGTGVGDIIDRQPPEWWLHGRGLELDEFYRGTLSQGLLYHEEQRRGYLPAGLVEEIRALMQPPIPWDVKLAHWFDEHFPPLARVRTFARPSRRQAATPGIIRPMYAFRQEDFAGRTFGIVLDTSMSMSQTVLGQALGAIASYSAARDVASVRLVYVDAEPYDEGYVEAARLLDVVQVKGRGGTVLQGAIDLLERADNFPKDAPILIITDGRCDRLRVRRNHAFLLPPGGVLPFPPAGPVFRVS